jgi:WD40 repeat protein
MKKPFIKLYPKYPSALISLPHLRFLLMGTPIGTKWKLGQKDFFERSKISFDRLRTSAGRYTLVFLMPLPCTAMEEYTIKEPHSIVFLTHNTVVVGGQNGCAIFNSNSQKLIKKLTSHNIKSLVANKDIIAIISCDEIKKKPTTKLTVFDAITQKMKWSEDNFERKLALSPAQSTLVASKGYYVDIYDYKKYETKDAQQNFYIEGLHGSISCNPIQNSLLYSTGTGLCIIHPSKKTYYSDFGWELIPLQNIHISHDYFAIGDDCMFGPDSHTILFKYNMGHTYASYFIYNLTDEKEIAHYILDSQEYSAFAFHPTLMVLAALSQEHRIKFWDYAAHKLIATTHSLSQNNHHKEKIENFTQQLSFSPDGSQLAVALPDAWHIIHTPHINKQSALVLHTLHTYIHKDVVPIIMQYMVGYSPLSYVNNANLVNITPLSIPVPTEIDPSQETQQKYVQRWIHFKDPDASSSTEEFY